MDITDPVITTKKQRYQLIQTRDIPINAKIDRRHPKKSISMYTITGEPLGEWVDQQIISFVFYPPRLQVCIIRSGVSPICLSYYLISRPLYRIILLFRNRWNRSPPPPLCCHGSRAKFPDRP